MSLDHASISDRCFERLLSHSQNDPLIASNAACGSDGVTLQYPVKAREFLRFIKLIESASLVSKDASEAEADELEALRVQVFSLLPF